MAKIEFKKKLLEYLEQKWGRDSRCPMCGHKSWTVHDTTFEIREFNEGNMVLGGPVIPVVTIMCTNCGNTLFVNALQAGAVEADEPDTSTKEETG